MAEPPRWRILLSVAWSALEATSSVLVSLVALLGIARLIGAAEFGLGALALGLVQILTVVLGSLFHDALVRGHDVGQRQVNAAWTAALLLGLLAFAGCLLLAWPLAEFFREPRFAMVFVVLAATLIPDAIAANLIAERRRAMDFRLVAVQYLIGRGSGAALGVLLAWYGYGVWSMVAQQVLTSLVILAILLLRSPFQPRWSADFAVLRPLVRFTSSIIGTQFVIQLGERLILSYVARVGDLTLAGYWGLATRLIDNLVRTINDSLYHVSLSYFAKVQDRPVELGALVRQANGWLVALVLPSLAVLAVLAPQVIELLLGPSWLPAAAATQILAIGAIFQLRRLMDHVALNALGHSDGPLWAHVVETAVVTAALFGLMPLSLAVIAVLRALRPLIGYAMIGWQSIPMTARSRWRELLDWGLDLGLLAAIVLVIHMLSQTMPANQPVLLLTSSAALALLTALALSVLLRPGIAERIWSLAGARGRFGWRSR